MAKKTTKKSAGKKSGSKKSASKKGASRTVSVGVPQAGDLSAAASKRQEIDVSQLSTADLAKRVTAIYKREKKVEAKTAVYALAKSAAKIAKGALQEAEDALRQEIDEQRWGPGPLFSPDGQGKA